MFAEAMADQELKDIWQEYEDDVKKSKQVRDVDKLKHV